MKPHFHPSRASQGARLFHAHNPNLAKTMNTFNIRYIAPTGTPSLIPVQATGPTNAVLQLLAAFPGSIVLDIVR